MIAGINHITLSIKNVHDSFDFYTRVLGAQPIAKWHKGAYVLLGGLWLALVLDEHCRADALPEYSHVAFSVSAKDFDALRARIQNAGAKIWQANWAEGDAFPQ